MSNANVAALPDIDRDCYLVNNFTIIDKFCIVIVILFSFSFL